MSHEPVNPNTANKLVFLTNQAGELLIIIIKNNNTQTGQQTSNTITGQHDC
jgi:hypothetical protein